MKESPVPEPEPASELDVLRAQVRELTAVKSNSMGGLASGLQTWYGEHPTMTALAALIADKANWRGEALRHRAVIERVKRLHDLGEDGNCTGCGLTADGNPMPWRDCPTMAACRQTTKES